MRDIKQIFQIAKQNFTGWRKNPRIWMTFALAFVLCLMLSDQVADCGTICLDIWRCFIGNAFLTTFSTTICGYAVC